MGGNRAPAPVGSIEKTNLDPVYSEQLRAASTGFLDKSKDFQNQARWTAGQFQPNYTQFAPNLQVDFQQFAPQGFNTNFQAQPGLDARTQTVLGLAQQQRAQALNAQQAQIQQQFGSQNPGMAQVLKAQAANRSALGANPLLFQATEAQSERQRQEQQMQNAALLQQTQQRTALQQLGNQAQLQQTEARAGLQGAQNQALAQQLAISAQPLQAQQNILSTLSNLGQLYGSRQSTPLGGGGGGRGGLFAQTAPGTQAWLDGEGNIGDLFDPGGFLTGRSGGMK